MGSLLKNKLFFLCVLTTLSMMCPALHAETPNSQTAAPTHDGYYRNYPPTTPATGDKAQLIKRGEYLAKAGDCIACHTDVKGGTPAYAGRLIIDTPFGIFYTPNITPDKKTGIGNWSEADFIRALKKGRSPNGHNYFPIFPYLYFATITDDDAHALYTYFMNIPAVELENKTSPFPYNMPGSRFSLWGWNLLFFFPTDHEFKENPAQSKAWNRGKYLVNGLGHCGMCHTPLMAVGAPKTKNYLMGGFIDGYWAPNIGKHALQSVSLDEIADVFSKNKLLNNAGPVAGPMAEVNHNSLNYLTRDDHLAIATYLKTVESEDPLSLPPSNKKPSLERGKEVYLKSCVICHQDGKMSAPLIGNSENWYMRLKDNGLATLYRHVIDGYNSMPLKGACVTCSDNDIISAVDYVLDQSLTRSQWLSLKNEKSKATPSMSDEQIYNQQCAACHNDGKNGAPKLGDKKVWAPIIEKNIDVLVRETMTGKNHPSLPQCKKCNTNDILQAIKYMVRKSKTDGNYQLW